MMKCDWCDESATLTCSRCGSGHYCSRDHQRLALEVHRDVCKAYRVNETEDAGRYLVASRPLVPGNLLIKEEPLVLGPLAISNLLCLTCHTPITQEDFYKCPDCFWPMCSLNCALAKSHALECDILSNDEKRVGVPTKLDETPRYDLILILRCLLLRETNKAQWNTLLSMASHAEKRKNEAEPYHVAAIRFFTEVCKINYDADIIHHARGAIVTNSIGIRGHSNVMLRALYPTISLMNHSCVPNVHLSCDPSGVMEARAAVKIAKGEPLTICYTGTTEPLWKRQRCLNETYYFECKCKRCTDQTELGTYFSSPRCPDCRRSFMLPKGDGSVDFWICETCGLKYEVIDVMQEVGEWLYRLDMNDVIVSDSPNKISKALDKVEDCFNASHYVTLQYTQAALKLLKTKALDGFKLRQRLWEQLLEIYNIIEPGYTRRRGMTLYEAGSAALEVAVEGKRTGEFSTVKFEEQIAEAMAYLKEAKIILQLEPRGSPEARWQWTIRDKLAEAEQLQLKEAIYLS